MFLLSRVHVDVRVLSLLGFSCACFYSNPYFTVVLCVLSQRIFWTHTRLPRHALRVNHRMCKATIWIFAAWFNSYRRRDPASTWEKFFLSKAEEDVTGPTFLPESRSLGLQVWELLEHSWSHKGPQYIWSSNGGQYDSLVQKGLKAPR